MYEIATYCFPPVLVIKLIIETGLLYNVPKLPFDLSMVVRKLLVWFTYTIKKMDQGKDL